MRTGPLAQPVCRTPPGPAVGEKATEARRRGRGTADASAPTFRGSQRSRPLRQLDPASLPSTSRSPPTGAKRRPRHGPPPSPASPAPRPREPGRLTSLAPSRELRLTSPAPLQRGLPRRPRGPAAPRPRGPASSPAVAPARGPAGAARDPAPRWHRWTGSPPARRSLAHLEARGDPASWARLLVGTDVPPDAAQGGTAGRPRPPRVRCSPTWRTRAPSSEPFGPAFGPSGHPPAWKPKIAIASRDEHGPEPAAVVL